MKYLIFLCPLLIFCSQQEQKKRNCQVYLSYNTYEKKLSYKIINTSNVNIFIPVNYKARITNDSVILEAYNKSDIIDYNKFVAPKMKLLYTDSTSTGSFKTNIEITKTPNYYVRLFDKDFAEYVSENKTQVITENFFIEYELKHSILIKTILKG